MYTDFIHTHSDVITINLQKLKSMQNTELFILPPQVLRSVRSPAKLRRKGQHLITEVVNFGQSFTLDAGYEIRLILSRVSFSMLY